MDQHQLARLLADQEDPYRIEELLHENVELTGIPLAGELRDLCYSTWNSEPVTARNASLAADALAGICAEPEIVATADWIRGISHLTKGELEAAVEEILKSGKKFEEIGKPADAARATVAILIPLALLGKYEEAIARGNRALKVISEEGDDVAAGKIELNLSNIASRRGDLQQAEEYGVAACERFISAGEEEWSALAENDLANTLVEQNRFREAEGLYLSALGRAHDLDMTVTRAEIEACLGNLATHRGKYDEALRYLETSRRRFEELDMPHQSATAELEMAGIYLALNLSAEAGRLLGHAADTLAALKLQGEEARARTELIKVRLSEGNHSDASELLQTALELYEKEQNARGQAELRLIGASMELDAGEPFEALKLIEQARVLAGDDSPRLRLECDCLQGEALWRKGSGSEAGRILRRTKDEAFKEGLLRLGLRATNSLAGIAKEAGETAKAVSEFLEAVELTESMREPIAAEEFRIAYLSDKLAPYENLVRLYADSGEIDQAFAIAERARARTLSEALGSGKSGESPSRDPKLDQARRDLREKLNWLYSRLRNAKEDDEERIASEAKEIERELSEIGRRIEMTREGAVRTDSATKIGDLQELLGPDSTLVEFVELDETFSAFILTTNGLELADGICGADEVADELEGLLLQFGTMRFGDQLPGSYADQLRARADRHLARLYDLLLGPLPGISGDGPLVVVPAGALNYVPFGALYDGSRYVVETRDVVISPGAAVWKEVSSRGASAAGKTLIFGFADEYIPNVDKEVVAIDNILDSAEVLSGAEATFENYVREAPAASILHLACHGKFRPDNPMFSSLHLADGNITVGDILDQELSARVVTLSACETGLSSIRPGNEILGLGRGFLSAGASNLVISLWSVNDAATLELMKGFYSGIRDGLSASAALGRVQREMIAAGSHPFYWAPFVTIGSS